MTDRLDWARDGLDWPHRETSLFVEAGGLRWHVQRAGSGPVALLLHGTAASTHSWAGLLPLLARRHTVIAPDLPGHGFSRPLPKGRMTLDSVAEALSALLGALDVSPELVIGHSAGAAVLVRMSARRFIAPGLIVSLNGALTPFRGVARQIFSPLAKLLVLNPVVPWLAAWRASNPETVRRLIDATGSKLDARGLDLYARLVGSPGHVAAALAMMAGWDLDRLQQDLRRLRTPLLLVAGSKDGTVPPEQAFSVRDIVPHARVAYLKGLGHLAHEEEPDRIDALIATHVRGATTTTTP